jgi:DNA-binding LacI/PurR family transcriptional regulator
MKPRVTQNELAARLGLSRSTVAAALNPTSPVKLTQETRQRVAAAAEKWNYRPDRYARVMRGGKSGLIGILHFGALLQVAAERVFYATEAVRQAGFECLSADLSWNTSSAEPTCLSMIDARVEGVVVAGLNDPAALPALEYFRAAHIPLVVLSGSPLPWAPHFRGDACQAYFELTRHLLDLGHRRLALMVFLSHPGPHRNLYTWTTGERVKGFKAALRQAKGQIVSTFEQSSSARPLGTISDANFSDDPFNPFDPGHWGMDRILTWKTLPTAILCSNDEHAYGAMKACREKDIAVPSQMAITGYDDIAVGRCCEIPMTTVRQPNRDMAEAAVRTLLNWIRGMKPKKSKTAQVFPCEVIIRRSSQAS